MFRVRFSSAHLQQDFHLDGINWGNSHKGRGYVHVTRGNVQKLQKSHVRVVNTYNNAPNRVLSANTNDRFRTRIDKLWRNQGIIKIWSQLQGAMQKSY